MGVFVSWTGVGVLWVCAHGKFLEPPVDSMQKGWVFCYYNEEKFVVVVCQVDGVDEGVK